MRKILVVGPAWVGDMVMAQSLFKALHGRDGAVHISVLAPGWSAPVLARMPEVAATIDMPVGHGALKLGVRRQVARKIRALAFDQAIVIPGSFKSALIPWFAAIPRRTGYIGEWRYGLLNDIRRLNPEALPQNVQRYVALGADENTPAAPPIRYPRLQVAQETREQARSRLSLSAARPIIGLCPGAAYGEAKRWPPRYFATVANAMLEAGYQVWIFGAESDAALGAEIDAATTRRCTNLAGRTTLAEAIDLMSLCRAVLTNDSGLMHIAAAVGCHVVALYGSSSNRFTPPLTDRCARLSLGLDCQPCFKRQCPLGHLNCLNRLLPETVIGAIMAAEAEAN